jgi:hypothetical protein
MSNDTITHKYGTVTFGEVRWDAFEAAPEGSGVVGHMKAWVVFRKTDESKAFAAQFPQSLRLRATTLSADYEGTWKQYGYVDFCVNFRADNVNKGVNETGAKRARSFFKALAKRNITPVRVKHFQNSIDFNL